MKNLTDRRPGVLRALGLLMTLLAVAALAGCGGGGGGGGGGSAGGGGSGGDLPQPTGLHIDQTQLSVTVEEGETVGDSFIAGSIIGATEPVMVTVLYTNRAIASADFALTSTVSGRVTIRHQPWSKLLPGTYNDTVTIQACFDAACARPVPGSPVVVPVTFTLKAAKDAPVLDLTARGVALAVVPQAARRTASARVSDSGGASSHWTASSDAAWLSVTPSGNSGGDLVLTADERGLAPGQYVATVTVRSDNPLVQQAATMRVGLYLGTASATQMADLPVHDNVYDAQRRVLVTDPIRPLLYTTDRGTVIARHFHTGQSVARWTLPSGFVEALAVSDDGRELYVLDSGNKSLAVIDLDRMVLQRTLTPPVMRDVFSTSGDARLASMRLGDRAVLLINNHGVQPTAIGGSPVLDPLTGQELGRLQGDQGGLNGADLAATPDGHAVYGIQTQVTGVLNLHKLTLQRNSLGTIFGRDRLSVETFPSAGAPRIRADTGNVLVGLNEYVESGLVLVRAPSPVGDYFAAPSFILDTLVHGVATDGRIVVIQRRWGDTDYTRATVRQFSPSGALLQQWQDVRLVTAAQALMPDGLSDLKMCVSSDGLRAQHNYQLLDLPR